ncbi:glycosyltransferase family 4 protein [Christiangramia sp. OXR-203]|jgi:glycosyltransferase involved in cell wall biosynthesis|uniref:glycosyltransferase family 4 protein n=1 Tax=Christiangramia sp. OXR-203 TaxID=3100176 RepID=UPI002AC8E806|nr:glycosyltransferase family 4 protein [Christiangramia sp. OXR-203]WPY99994.1 glycosyltransferase family 4 protein [Christiangramia sp. OXR-203]
MKKALIVTYYWPPAGGPGVQRWLKFVTYLRDFSIEPVVYIPENPNYPLLDKSLVAEIPTGIRVLKQPIFEPYKFAEIFSRGDSKTISSGIIAKEQEQSAIQKLMLFVRGNFFIPDARKFWVKPSVNYLKSVLEKEMFDVLITTGPPHSLHLIGLELQKNLNIKWIADFRDPWTEIGYHKKLKLTRSSRQKHKSLESEVLNKADHIITTSYTTKAEFESKTTRPIRVITNGFDKLQEESITSEDFEISHIGSLLSGRSPDILWKAIAEIVEDDPAFRNKLKIRLAGKISSEVKESIEELGLQKYLQIEGYVSHKEALELQNRASILLLLEIDSLETRGIIPGKIFEYFAAKRPILAIGPENWEAGKMVLDTQSGTYLLFGDKEKVKSWIKDQFYQKELQGIKRINSDISQYHRKELTGELADLINKI